MTLLTSILKDCKRWKQIKANNWQWHALIALIGSILLYRLIGNSITDIYVFTKVFLKIALPSAGGSVACWLFERWQQYVYFKEPMTERETFESNKDWLVGSIFCLIGTVIAYCWFG